MKLILAKRKEVDRFVKSYLRCDGLLVLRMVEIHAGVLFGTDLILSLWNAFYEIEEKARYVHFSFLSFFFTK